MASCIAEYASKHFANMEVTAPDVTHGRRLITKQAFQPGDLIFVEQAVLHTSHPIARSFEPDPDSEIPSDWQRLLHLYAHLRSTPAVQLAMNELSVEGVTSPSAQAADPERASEYRAWAEEWAASAEPPISANEAYRLLAIIETNSHARDETDQFDLNDPLLPIAPIIYRGKLVALSAPDADVKMDEGEEDDGEEDTEGDEEATGLYILASIANHSCLPNCVAHIPASDLSSTSMPPLYLRCIRAIAPSDELTISYHSEEFQLTADRQHQLSSRGFACTCPLCVGAVSDWARGIACARCADGVCAPRAGAWACDRCGAPLDDAQVRAVGEAEDVWVGWWGQRILPALDSGNINIDFAPFTLLRALAALPAFPSETALLRASTAIVAPLHATHVHVYSFLRYMLFERSFVLRSEFNVKGDVKGDSAIWGVLSCMEAILERAGLGVESEERRAVGFWVAKEAKRMVDSTGMGEESEKWRIVMDQGYARWEEGMRILYGRAAQQ